MDLSWSVVLGLTATVVPTAAVVIVAWIQWRANDRAHAAIGRRIEAAEARAEKRADALAEGMKALGLRMDRAEARAEKRADAQADALQAIARDVSFLAGRQAQRDHDDRSGT